MQKCKNLLLLLICLLSSTSQNKSIPGLEGFGVEMNLIIAKTIIVPDERTLKAQLSNQQDSFRTQLKMMNKQFLLSAPIVIQNLNDILIIGPCTFKNYGIVIKNSYNIILSNIRIYNTSLDGILVYNSSNVVIDSTTILDSSRSDIVRGKDIDLTQNSTNITISHSIIGYIDPPDLQKYKGMLIANFSGDRVTNISVHHCLFYKNYQRSPQISTPGLMDFKNNIVYGYTEYGTRVRNGAHGNFVSNYYIGGKKDPMIFVEPEIEVFSKNNYWMYDFNFKNWSQIHPKITHQIFNVPKVTTLNKRQISTDMMSWGCHGDLDSILIFEKPILKKVKNYLDDEEIEEKDKNYIGSQIK